LIWLCGWACSAALLAKGVESIAMRYAISAVVSYAVFFVLVRFWCDFAALPLKPLNKKDGWKGEGIDALAPLGEAGWFIVILLAAIFIAFLLSWAFWLAGGYAALFEVAFEVAFAGTVVRGLDRQYTVGNWVGALLRRTWIPALLVASVFVGIAAKMQIDHPEAKTIAQAVKAVRSKTK
jgi:hypothetical protein